MPCLSMLGQGFNVNIEAQSSQSPMGRTVKIAEVAAPPIWGVFPKRSVLIEQRRSSAAVCPCWDNQGQDSMILSLTMRGRDKRKETPLRRLSANDLLPFQASWIPPPPPLPPPPLLYASAAPKVTFPGVAHHIFGSLAPLFIPPHRSLE